VEELQSVIRYVVIIVATLAALVLGDYLGYKIGRKRLVITCIVAALLGIIIFAVYAAVVLLG
jgi:hypothetical protein